MSYIFDIKPYLSVGLFLFHGNFIINFYTFFFKKTIFLPEAQFS